MTYFPIGRPPAEYFAWRNAAGGLVVDLTPATYRPHCRRNALGALPAAVRYTPWAQLRTALLVDLGGDLAFLSFARWRNGKKDIPRPAFVPDETLLVYWFLPPGMASATHKCGQLAAPQDIRAALRIFERAYDGNTGPEIVPAPRISYFWHLGPAPNSAETESIAPVWYPERVNHRYALEAA